MYLQERYGLVIPAFIIAKLPSIIWINGLLVVRDQLPITAPWTQGAHLTVDTAIPVCLIAIGPLQVTYVLELVMVEVGKFTITVQINSGLI